MNRRQFLSAAAAVAPDSPVVLPVHIVLDQNAKWPVGRVKHFHETLWSECVRDFGRSGVRMRTTGSDGRVERPHGREPVISGLNPEALNIVVTDRVPEEWDQGRALAGVTAIYRGYHMCLIALDRAHGHRIPMISVNTCTHELLHAVMGDIFERKPRGVEGEWRETKIDAMATRLWWWSAGSLKDAARVYVERLKASYYPRS